MSDSAQVRYEQVGRVARLVLNRPQYRNAQSRMLIEELDAAFARAAEDDGVGVIVLAGAGDHFSAGHDLGTPEELADREARPYAEGLRGRYRRSWEMNIGPTLRWRNIPKPTVAAVQGYCIFAGWIISSACDVVFAADDAMFLPTNFQYFSVPWDIHPRKAKAILFESRFIGAEEAEKLGFVDRVVPRARLDDEVMAYAARVAENDPFQLAMIKQAVNQALDEQGFTAHIQAAHAMYMLSSGGEADPGYALQKPEGRRRPMVQRAMENYERHRGQHGSGA
ncbi:MAG: enoyl-CoA hydratase/isomerase family protein [Chloroflexi bacterium]|nr:enoyl-CoA hydratase/isomerase family protein [Chloroflexota bacterium]